MRTKAVSVLAGILLLGGCATFEVGTTQDIDVTTPSADGATCVLSNADGQRSVTTPATVRIGRSRSDLTVRCTKPGFLPAVTVVRAGRSEYHTQIKDPSFLSLPEIAVDAASGAMWEYPGTVAVTMTPQ
jgi:hypothetical protein